MKNLVAITLLLLCGVSSHAADILLRGTVRDGEINVPLIGAVVAVEALQSKPLQVGATTDFQGAFSLLLPGESDYTITISFPGYVSFSTTVSAVDVDNVLSVALTEDLTLTYERREKRHERERHGKTEHLVYTGASMAATPYASKTADPSALADSMTRKMKNKLQLTPEQALVVGLANQKYFFIVVELQSSPGDSAATAGLSQVKKARTQRLEEILTESQFEKWMRYTQK